ncbi:hypothetical protein P152DRAFT_507219 [Eremomyces bilateralis CBS 781.70]|uniref:AB hydrolase-1 domain-containing protein n=1 Tax=Eremomyces bilateralis CBS 781.70 TaxID=1392243 RepID=A0A6G1G4N0_9PEZI|nr:uncharacterized protein P152DRAFT_507219 [Eremomyces bilateralis CBS 781.70]KAF1812901.1 hypothetical protein P152DRAFT_507219 [Eremomyces bilateralis CBS 781.70]
MDAWSLPVSYFWAAGRAELQFNSTETFFLIRPVLVFVSEAWHGPTIWNRVVPDLENQRYRCISVALPTTFGDPSADFADDVQAVQNDIIAETRTGRNIVVVVHSYGGVVGQSAIRDLTQHTELFYIDLPKGEGDYWASKLANQSAKAFTEGRYASYPGWKDASSWFLMATDFVKATKGAGASVTVRDISSGHTPILSRPKETVDFILEALAAFLESLQETN